MMHRALQARPHRRPAAYRQPHILFYDGDCGLCRRAVRQIRRRQPLSPIDYIDVHDDSAMSRHPQIDRAEATRRVILLRPDGRQLAGYNAVTGVMRLLPRWRRLHPLARFLPVQMVGHLLYAIVGHNRHRISRMFGWE